MLNEQTSLPASLESTITNDSQGCPKVAPSMQGLHLLVDVVAISRQVVGDGNELREKRPVTMQSSAAKARITSSAAMGLGSLKRSRTATVISHSCEACSW